MSVLEQLLSIQEHDTALEQMRHRRDHLPERAELASIDERDLDLGRRRAEVEARRDELTKEQRRHEDEVASIEAKITEVDGQLYGGKVTSPRELQALQDEIGALRRRADDIETTLLEVLTALEPVEETIESVDAEAAALATDREVVTVRLSAAEASVEAEIVAEEAARQSAAEGVPADQLDEYESIRARQGGIAVARLVGSSCGACHLMLSAVDLDRIRKLPADQPGICEECGRMLVH